MNNGSGGTSGCGKAGKRCPQRTEGLGALSYFVASPILSNNLAAPMRKLHSQRPQRSRVPGQGFAAVVLIAPPVFPLSVCAVLISEVTEGPTWFVLEAERMSGNFPQPGRDHRHFTRAFTNSFLSLFS